MFLSRINAKVLFIVIFATIREDRWDHVEARLYYKLDTDPSYRRLPLRDDGLGIDQSPGDGFAIRGRGGLTKRYQSTGLKPDNNGLISQSS